MLCRSRSPQRQNFKPTNQPPPSERSHRTRRLLGPCHTAPATRGGPSVPRIRPWRVSLPAASSSSTTTSASPRLRPFPEPPRRRIALRPRSTGPRRGARLRCLAETKPVEPTPVESPPADEITLTSEPETTKENANLSVFPNRNVNRRIALTSTLAAVGLFLSRRLDFGVSLKDLSANAIPYEEALTNGKPTVVEFYADWCEVCRELAPQIFQVEQQYRDQVNFVMLNVDNTKWEQELVEFGVEGISHFTFLDKDGNEE